MKKSCDFTHEIVYELREERFGAGIMKLLKNEVREK